MDRVLAIQGVEDLKGKMVFKGLFGDDLVFAPDKDEKPGIPVASKLTKRENEALERLAFKFGMSKCKFIRYCIRQKMKDLIMLIEP